MYLSPSLCGSAISTHSGVGLGSSHPPSAWEGTSPADQISLEAEGMALSCPSDAAVIEVRLNKASLLARTPWAYCSPCPAGGPIEPGVYGDDFATSSCLQEATNESMNQRVQHASYGAQLTTTLGTQTAAYTH